MLLTMMRRDEGFVVTDLSSANGTLVSDGNQVNCYGFTHVIHSSISLTRPKVTKMATGSSLRLRDKSTVLPITPFVSTT
jgi:hypothetical protein